FLNPIVRYARRHLEVAVRDVDVMVRGSMRLTFQDGTTEAAGLSDSVQRFLDAFNEGEYPDLEVRLEGPRGELADLNPAEIKFFEAAYFPTLFPFNIPSRAALSATRRASENGSVSA